MRTIGGLNLYGTATYGLSTYSVLAPPSDLALRLLDDPALGDGVSVGPSCSGGLRFVIQALNPTPVGGAVYGTAVYGTAVYSSSAGAWQDITDTFRGGSWNNGQNSPTTKAIIGTSTLTFDNRNGAMSPWALSGPFVGGGNRSWLRAGLIIRFGVIKTSALAAGLPALDTFSAFFTGKLETVVDDTSENVDGWVTVTLAELPTEAGGVTPADQAVFNGRGLSPTIWDAIVGASWPYQTDLKVPTEDAVCGPSVLTGSTSLVRIGNLTDNMHWDVVADGRGRMMIVRRHLADSAAGVVFANYPSGTQLPAVKILTYSSIERIIDQVIAARVTAADVIREDTRAMDQFGTINTGYGFPRNDLVLQDDVQVAALAQRVISLRAWDDHGIESMDIDADNDPIRLPAVLAFLACRGREVISFDVVYTHPSGHVLTETVVIEGQTHNIVMVEPGAAFKWTTTFKLGHSGVTTEV